jgi:hypothetical protein
MWVYYYYYYCAHGNDCLGIISDERRWFRNDLYIIFMLLPLLLLLNITTTTYSASAVTVGSGLLVWLAVRLRLLTSLLGVRTLLASCQTEAADFTPRSRDLAG